jgi:hypothetical protein
MNLGNSILHGTAPWDRVGLVAFCICYPWEEISKKQLTCER